MPARAGQCVEVQRAQEAGSQGLALCRCTAILIDTAWNLAIDHCVVQALPQPMIRISKRWQVPRSALAVRLLYDVPLGDVDHFWEPPARLLLRSASHSMDGLHG